jgi:hypothetical protein
MFTTPKSRWVLGLAACVLLAGAAAARAEGPPALDEGLLKNAPLILDYLHGKNERKQAYHNAGVLKFLVQRGDGSLVDNAGPLNRSLADRLEVALILANEDNKLGILSRAGDGVAAAGMHATHRTPEGRARFFDIPPEAFTRSWGKLTEGPDCFLTGEARLSADLRTVSVKVQAFGKGDPKDLVTVCTFEAVTDERTLGEAGLRYLSPRPRGLPIPVIKKLAEDKEKNISSIVAASSTDKETGFKLVQQLEAEKQEDPIELVILYNGKPVPRDAAGVPTPDEGTKVQLRLTNRTRDVTYGVVLLVNGENTIFREEQGPPLEMYKWVVEPGKSITIDGYQINNQKCDAFQVLPPRESEERAVHYGKDAGLISLWVFRGVNRDETEFAKYEAPKVPDDVRLVSKGAPKRAADGQPFNDLLSLKNRLRNQLRSDDADEAKGPRAKGLIVSGGQAKSVVETTPFKAYPVPVKFDTIRYYQPTK